MESLVKIIAPPSMMIASHRDIQLPKTTVNSPTVQNREPMLASLKSFKKLYSKKYVLSREESSTEAVKTHIQAKSGLASK